MGETYTLNLGDYADPPPPFELNVVWFRIPQLLPMSGVTPGAVVLLDANGSLADNTTWSDVLFFLPNPRGFVRGALISDKPGEQGITDADLVPLGTTANPVTVASIQADPNTQAIPEAGPPTVYVAGTATYNVYSDVEGGGGGAGANPEPGTFVLLGVGALGLIGYVWRRRQRAL
jgi:hypothetical protein